MKTLPQATKRSGGRTDRPNRVRTGGEDGEGDNIAECCGDEAAGGKDCGDDTAGGEGPDRGLEGTGEFVGADISGGKKGFNLSTETVQGFPDLTKTNVFSPLSRTL